MFSYKIHFIYLFVTLIFGLTYCENKTDNKDDIFPLKELASVRRKIGLKVFFDSSQCAHDIRKVYKAIKDKQLWAVKSKS